MTLFYRVWCGHTWSWIVVSIRYFIVVSIR